MSSTPLNIILNGNIVKGMPGETILQLARRHGIRIPTLCHDDRLEPFSSCYLCVVEVEGMKGHQPSCSTKIAEGMKITTDNESIRKSRKMALELMLSNHYADCIGPCKQTCPAGVDVQGYISLIDKGLYHEAVALIKETNPLPAICGRVCVRPCEAQCRRNLLGEGTPVGIDYMKRFAADYDLSHPGKFVPETAPPTGKRVAVIGAGPGGLSAAYFLQVRGHQADIYEAAPQPGGWLRYGIPEYRLPNDILDQEVKNITDLGVRICYRQRLGDNLSYKKLQSEYDAVILTIGSQKGTNVGCEGDDALNVFSGIDFLKNMEVTGQRYDFTGKTIAVVGGGNTAMDCCRTSIRCNGEKVYVIYRRTEKEMPANPIEIHESKIEGVEYLFLTLPKKINKNGKGEVESITCIKMELGEPDASGRRRPVPVEGSDFELKVDFILAAIGQKTDVNFIDDINAHAGTGQLKITKWGDIEADKATLQTGIPSVFAAGDGVTGPATIIEAIAQAKIASHSAHQYLSGEAVTPLKKPFTSTKENFRKQEAEDYAGRVVPQQREEMPVLPATDRKNFREVELGYAGEETARHEAQRCLECGCTAFFDCDLQKYSTEYGPDQKTFAGSFREFPVDFRHPYIEIDNNKCILCARCVRICREVVGANALGLVNRGFDTFVAPAMKDSLAETRCESCGMCISACPTGAITENVIFKPGPVKTETADTICNYCSVGCAVTLHHRKGFVTGVSGAAGLVNPDASICRLAKFGYGIYNEPVRITRPLLKTKKGFREIGFDEAFNLIAEKIRSVKPDENGFFAGARLTNEEMYLIQKLARAAVGTGNLASFQYIGRGDAYRHATDHAAPLAALKDASRIYLLGAAVNRDYGVAGYLVSNARYVKKTPVVLITAEPDHPMEHKTDEVIRVKSYYYFVKSLNHFLLSAGLENGLFLRDRTEDFEDYKLQLLAEDYGRLLNEAGVSAETVKTFAEQYNNELNAILVWSEKEISGNASIELTNLAMITGKHGKSANGLIVLREKNNTQGLFDTGISRTRGVGSQALDEDGFRARMKEVWKVNEVPGAVGTCLKDQLSGKKLKNVFVFGEDPAGCGKDDKVKGWLKEVPFLVVQDYFLTATAEMAHLILPASFPAETGGSFTNTQKVIQEFDAVMEPKTGLTNIGQLLALLGRFGFNGLSNPKEVFLEFIGLLPQQQPEEKLRLDYTPLDNVNRNFEYGCDAVVKRFEETFSQNLIPQNLIPSKPHNLKTS